MTTRHTTRLSLDDFPTELIHIILLQITDLGTLCNFIYASPLALRTFNAHKPAVITETVLTSGYTCSQIIFMFRSSAMYRSRRFPPSGSFEYACKTIEEPMRVPPPKDVYQPEPLPEDTKLGVIHDLLIVARDVQNISLDYLGVCLRRFRSLPRRRHVDEFTSPHVSSGDVATCLTSTLGIPRQAKLGSPANGIQGVGIGTPTWIEEQRVIRAFWRLQYAWEVNDFNHFRPEARGSWNMTFWGIYYGATERLLDPSRLNIPASANERGAKPMYTANMHNPEEASPAIPNPEFYDILSALNYIGTRFGQEAADEMADNHESVPELVQQEDPAASIGFMGERSQDCLKYMPTGNDEEKLLQPSAAVRRAYQRPLPDGQKGNALLDGIGLAPFFSYGFSFWSDERMQSCGFAAPWEDDISSTRAMIDEAWLSVLSPEELTLAKDKYGGSTRTSE